MKIKIALALFSIGVSLLAACSRDDALEPKGTPQPSQGVSKDTRPLSVINYKPSQLEPLKYEPLTFKIADSDEVKWDQIQPKSQRLEHLLKALHEKNYDLIIKEGAKDKEFCPYINCFGQTDMGDEVNQAIDELTILVEAQPALAVELGQLGEVGKDFTYAVEWYGNGVRNGSIKARERLLAMLKGPHSEAIEALAFFTGTEGDRMRDPILAARTASKRLGNQDATNEEKRRYWLEIGNAVAGVGPALGAEIAPEAVGIFGYKPSTPAVAQLAHCLENGTPLHDHDQSGSYEVNYNITLAEPECFGAIVGNPNNGRAWFAYGHALSQIEGKEAEAMVVHARAAQLGYAEALADFWYQAYGFNTNKALVELEKIAAGGNPWAHYAQATIYSGVLYKGARDPKKFMEKLLLSANADLVDAQAWLADEYKKQGKANEAMHWLKVAAKHRNDSAIEVGDMYRDGTGITADKKEAEKWYRYADSRGSNEASAALASLSASAPVSVATAPMKKQEVVTNKPKLPNQQPGDVPILITGPMYFCFDPKSLYQVNSLIAANNSYASYVPPGCEYVDFGNRLRPALVVSEESLAGVGTIMQVEFSTSLGNTYVGWIIKSYTRYRPYL